MFGDVAFATTFSGYGSSTNCYVVPSGIGIPNVNINVTNLQNGSYFNDVTDMNGIFEGSIPAGQIRIIPSKNCSTYSCWVNGVTTWDLVLIRRHYNNWEKIGCPFRRIAADANNSGTITSDDENALQQLILGNTQSLTNVPAWRFVSNMYFGWYDNLDTIFRNIFWNMQSLPLDYYPFEGDYNYGNAIYEYNTGTTWMDKLNVWELTTSNDSSFSFMALKVGDINGNSSLNQFREDVIEDRNLFVTYSDKEIQAKEGEELLVHFKAKDFKEISAYQLGLWFDPEKVEIISPKNGNLPGTNKENFGLTKLDNGELRTIWLEPEGKSFSYQGKPRLFTLHLKTKVAIDNISDFLILNDQVLMNEFYRYDGSLSQVELDFDVQTLPSQTNESSISAMVYPNPFGNETVIAFNLPQSSRVNLIIRDAWGKTLEIHQQSFKAGYNEITLGNNLPTGLLFYFIEANNMYGNGIMVKKD